ncbi:hypothetical protein P167DRAFT_412505 [Morchella conica CCBAS932]|uniref:Ubiquitin-like domain-containing protein n=2 Tax=Morchella sect. Distantes TaxID=1051054 RepID=A0A3N4KYS7_9PEZI|nr:hypothetical protein P167DRAFT_412505 [Morchella conica CCBAS932]
MSFGFSIGEFIAAIGNTFKTSSEINGSRAERAELAQQLGKFRLALANAKRLAIDLKLSQMAIESVEKQLAIEALNTVRSVGEIKRKSLDRRIPAPLKPALNGSPLGRDEVACKEENMRETLDDLRKKITLLEILLQECNSDTIRDIGGPAAPKQPLGFEVIYFIDAFGRRRVFDFDMCKKCEDFHDLVKFNLKDSTGKGWVNAGQYEISDETTGIVLTAKNWDTLISPGMTLFMAMILEIEVEDTEGNNNCPSCDSTHCGAKANGLQQLYCPECAAVFKIMSRQQIDQPVNDNIITNGRKFDGDGVDAKPDEEPTFLKISDLKTFRRFHVYQNIVHREEQTP